MLTLNFTPFPEIHTDRLLLKKTTEEHLNDLFEMRSDPEAMKYIGKPLAKTIDDAKTLLEKMDTMLNANDGISWGIFFKDSNELIGSVSYHRIEKQNYRAEIGYMLKTAHIRKGIMKEVLPAIISYGFNELGLHSIEAIINPKNTASAALLEKFNFIREGYFKENFCFEGVFSDSAVYSLLK